MEAWGEAAELERLHATDNFLKMDLIARLPYNPHISAFVMAESHREIARKAKYDALHAAERTRILERAKTQIRAALNAAYDFTHILVNQLRSLWSVAKIADIDLEITTDSRIQNPESLEDFVEIHRTYLEEFHAFVKDFMDDPTPRA